MAKKAVSKPGKAAAIRDFLQNNPKAGAIAVAAALNEKGFDCTPAYVSTIKSLDKKKRRRGARKAAATTTAVKVENGLSISVLLQAKKLAAQLGGVASAKAALDALAKLGM